MAKIRTYGAPKVGLVAPRVPGAVQASPEDFGAGVAREAAKASQVMAQETSRWMQTFTREKIQTERAQVRDALNQARERIRLYTLGTEDAPGVLTLKGGNATDLSEGARDELDKIKRELGGGFVNARQQDLWNANIDNLIQRTMSRVEHHQAEEAKHFNIDTLEASANNGAQDAIAAMDTPEEFASVMTEWEADVRALHAELGSPPEKVDEDLAVRQNNIYAEIVEAKMKRGDDDLGEWWAKNKEYVLPSQRDNVGAAIEVQSRAQRVTNEIDDWMDNGYAGGWFTGTGEEISKAEGHQLIRDTWDDPKDRAYARQYFDMRVQQREDERREAGDQSMVGYVNLHLSGEYIDPRVIAADNNLRWQEKLTVLSLNGSLGKTSGKRGEVLSEFAAMTDEEIGQMSRVEITKKLNGLDPSDKDRIFDEWQKLRKGERVVFDQKTIADRMLMEALKGIDVGPGPEAGLYMERLHRTMDAFDVNTEPEIEKTIEKLIKNRTLFKGPDIESPHLEKFPVYLPYMEEDQAGVAIFDKDTLEITEFRDAFGTVYDWKADEGGDRDAIYLVDGKITTDPPAKPAPPPPPEMQDYTKTGGGGRFANREERSKAYWQGRKEKAEKELKELKAQIEIEGRVQKRREFEATKKSEAEKVEKKKDSLRARIDATVKRDKEEEARQKKRVPVPKTAAGRARRRFSQIRPREE